MASFTTFFSLYLYTITVFLLDQGAGKNRSACPTEFSCGSLGTMKYPFSSNISRPECGLLRLECDAVPLPRIRIGRKYYYVYGKLGDYIRLYDPELEQIVLNRPRCNSFDTNVSFPNSPWVSFVIPHNFTVFKCPKSPNLTQQMNIFGYSNHTKCGDFSLFYRPPGDGDPLPNLPNHHGFPPKCSPILLPFEKEYSTDDLFDIISVTFVLEWLLSEDCSNCQKSGGQCVTTANNQFHCSKERGNSYWRTIVMAALGGIAVFLSLLLILILWRRKREEESPYIFSRNASRDPCLSHDLEMGGQSFGVPVFSFKELKDATKNFDSSSEIGDGGFGTVYHGVKIMRLKAIVNSEGA
nr:LEAF RUST 10 DISEASE-RESISTANCE LOCUS RECEPTOR-LIKE PROTEIN KINASE-like 1.1 [Ipomoea trifida]